MLRDRRALLPLLVFTLTLVFAPLAYGASCYRSFSASLFEHCHLLTPALALHWRADGEGVAFAIDLDGKWGFVGLGVSESGGMLAADMAISRLNAEGFWSVEDYWSMRFGTPALDVNTQDAVLLAADQTPTATRVVFWRPLDTCDDTEDMRIIPGVTSYVIFAYGPSFGYHGPIRRGTVQLPLLPLRQPSPPPVAAAGAPLLAPSPSTIGRRRRAAGTGEAATTTNAARGSGAGNSFLPVVITSNGTKTTGQFSWEMRMDNVTVPADSAYLCRHFQLPNPATKVHVTEYEPLLTNAAYVHHMIIYACSRPPEAPQQLYSCFSMDAACQAFYILWAPGAGVSYAPPEAGYAFGGDTLITWVSLQVHYTNLAGTPGVLDSSGFRLRATTQLRPYDLGVLALGPLDFEIPPGEPSFSFQPNVCPKACTERLPHPLTLVSSVFHMHLLGRQAKTQWVRNGVERAPLGERKMYSFNYQGETWADPSAGPLLPGDELITTCTWDSSSRDTSTYYGENTVDEMCYNFVAYYPAVPGFEICSSVSFFPDSTSAVCTSAEKVEALYAAGSPAELENLFTEMVVAGEALLDVPLEEYVPYDHSATCVPTTVPPALLDRVYLPDAAADPPPTASPPPPKPSPVRSPSPARKPPPRKPPPRRPPPARRGLP